MSEDALRLLRKLSDRAGGQLFRVFKLNDVALSGSDPFELQRARTVRDYLLNLGLLEGVGGDGIALNARSIQELERPRGQEGRAQTFGPIAFAGPATVTFGDGSPINIGSVSVGDFLRGLEAEVKSR